MSPLSTVTFMKHFGIHFDMKVFTSLEIPQPVYKQIALTGYKTKMVNLDV
jgi:hypothetical protein